MSLKEQLKNLSTPISSSYAIDSVRRKSLVYENPHSVDALTCYHDCMKAFNKLCEVDPEMQRFNQTLFSPETIKLEMTILQHIHKTKIDEQVALFLFMINTHIRSTEAAWALEWLIYKFQIHLNYVDSFMMLLLPHYETGFFAKGVQLLDFRQTASQWQWLQSYAERGATLSRSDFLKACRSQPTVIPFIGTLMSTYVKYELALSLNRLQTAGSFFVSVITGLCDSGLPEVKMAKIVTSLQGTIRKGLRTPELPAFQSAAGLAAVRIALSLKINKELVLDWIGCLLKKTRNGAEWESIRMVGILMRTQGIAFLPDELSDLHQKLLNSMSPIERALLENEENKALENVDINDASSSSLGKHERVQKATLVMAATPMDTPESSNSLVPGQKRLRKLTVKRISKMNYEDLFSQDPELKHSFQLIHGKLAAAPNKMCVMAQYDEKCSCPSTPIKSENSTWLSEFLIGASLRFTEAGSEVDETDVQASLKLRQAKTALQMVTLVFEATDSHTDTPTNRSPRTRKSMLPDEKGAFLIQALDTALPCVLVALLHPYPEVRVAAYDLVQRYIDFFGKTPPTTCRFTGSFISDLRENNITDTMSESIRQFLQGDALPALVRTSGFFVQAVFRALCRQPLDDSPISQVSWFAATHLLHTDLLPSLIDISNQATRNETVKFVGWPALLHLIKRPQLVKNQASHRACIDRLDALTLRKLASLSSIAKSVNEREPLCIALHEAELLDALLDLAGSQPANATSDLNLPSVLSRLLLKVEHYAYCLSKLDAIRLRNTSQSLFVRVASVRKTPKDSNKPDEESQASAERSRLRALKLILSTLAADMHRLQTEMMLSAIQNNNSTPLDGDINGQQPSTPLSSAVSRLKTGARRRSSMVVTRGKLTASGDEAKLIGLSSESGSEEGMKDLVFPLNSHLFSCISAETRFQRDAMVRSRLGGRQRTLSTNSSVFLSDDDGSTSGDNDDEDEGIQDDVDMRPIPLSDEEGENEMNGTESSKAGGAPHRLTAAEAASLREQSSVCAFEALVALTRLFAEGNRLAKEEPKRNGVKPCSPLAPSTSVSAVMDTIFQCLSVFKETASIQRQVMLCLIEMASLFPVILCRNLVTLVQWAGGHSSSSSLLLRLDDVHNLSLLGRLISVAVPALIQASKHRVDAALRVLTIFVRGLPDLPANLPRRALALYAGLLRGLAQVVAAPVSTHLDTALCSGNQISPGTGRKITKQAALQGWLWTATLIFLNTEWPSQETADLVFPLLIDLFNQFDLPTQLASWHQCMDVFLQLLTNPEISNPKQATPSHRAKRAHLESPTFTPIQRKIGSPAIGNSSAQDYALLLKYLASPEITNDDTTVASLPTTTRTPSSAGSNNSRKRRKAEPEADNGGCSLWPLLAEVSGLISGLLGSAGHQRRREEAINRSGDLAIEENFGGVVKLVVQLLVNCSGRSAIGEETGVTQARQTAAQNLQEVLVQMNSVMPNEIFLDSVARLMSNHQANLTRKALELLLAKLDNLTSKCPSATSLLTGVVAKQHQPVMEGALERGLLNLFSQLSESLIGSKGAFFSGDKTQSKLLHLRLSCLRELAQLLCQSHPNELLKTMDAFIADQPSHRWWLRTADVAAAKTKAGRLATSAAEARSLACLFALECLARLPPAQIALCGGEGSSGAAAVRAPRVRAQRVLRFALDQATTACRLAEGPAADCVITVGKVHSREQHLQAGVTLLLGSFEFCTSRGNAAVGTENGMMTNQTESVLERLREGALETRTPNTAKTAEVPPLDTALLAFLFRSTHLDLVSATQAKVDRSAAALKQSAAIIRRLRSRFIALPESLNLLILTQDLITKDVTVETDSNLISGGLDFLSRHADHVRSLAAVSEVDIDATNPGEGLPNTLETAYASNPAVIWRLLQFALETKPQDSDSVVAKAACAAGASLLAALNRDYRLQLVAECLRWTVAGKPAMAEVVTRMTSLLVVLERLSTLISPEYFVSLVKNANLINLFVTCLSLLSGEQKSRGVRKLASPLELPHLVDCFSGMTSSHAEGRLDCIRATLGATAAWLRAESKLSACLDTAGTDAVLALPSAIVQTLNYSSSGLNEADLVPCVASFLSAIGGDEALLRPFGSALCALVTRGTHWRTRLAALRLLKQTFDTLLEPEEGNDEMQVQQHQPGDLGLAACLVSDTLVALSEALEDEKPEVEAAANRLFADLEAAGATTSSGAAQHDD